MRPSLTSMWSSPTLAILVAVGIAALGDPVAVLSAAPMLALWFAAPLIAYRTSRPRQVERVELSEDEQRGLRDIARRTWLFFETFVTEQGNWLPPDNYQEQPGGIVAYRTSPTNQGMLLASVLGARDLGYVGLHALVDLLEKSLDVRGELVVAVGLVQATLLGVQSVFPER